VDQLSVRFTVTVPYPRDMSDDRVPSIVPKA